MHRMFSNLPKTDLLVPKFMLLLVCLSAPACLHAQTISGTVVDSSGAVVVGARIEVSGGDLTQPVVLSSDGRGMFFSPELKPGSYTLHVTREGFEPLNRRWTCGEL